MAKTKNSYDGSSITMYEHVKAVQKRPGMYVGAGRQALIQIAYEIITNSSDEIDAGYGDTIEIQINKNGSLKVSDNGRGIPWQDTKTASGKMMPACIVSSIYLHAGGKFGGDNAAYSSSGGLNGVGLTACNALSSKFKLTTTRDGKIRYFECENGNVTKGLTEAGKVSSKTTGTCVEFTPNPKYFSEGVDYTIKELEEKCKYLPYLNNKLKIRIIEEETKKNKLLYHSKGLKEYITDNYKDLVAPVFTAKNSDGTYEVRIAWDWSSNDPNEEIVSFANCVLTKSGGSHVIGFRRAIALTLNKYIQNGGYLTGKNKDLEIEPDDCREALKAIIAIKALDPNVNLGFQSQTKDEIINPDIQKLVSSTVSTFLKDALDANSALAKKIAIQVIAAARGRLAAKRARERERKDVIKSESISLPKKLSDCICEDPSLCSLFIVEGKKLNCSR